MVAIVANSIWVAAIAAIAANCLVVLFVSCVLAFEHLHHDRVRVQEQVESSACRVLSPDASTVASAALTDYSALVESTDSMASSAWVPEPVSSAV